MSWPWEIKAAVDERFYAQQPTAFTVTKADTWRGPGFNVTNLAGGPAMMHVQTAVSGNGNLRSLVLLDPASHGHIVALKESRLGISGERQWEASRGRGASATDRLFAAVDKTRFFQLGNTVHVFLDDGESSGQRVPDFVVQGSYHCGTMSVSRGGGDGGDYIAQIRKESSTRASLIGDNTYSVWINRGVDQAFVLAIAVILDRMLGHQYDPKGCSHQCNKR